MTEDILEQLVDNYYKRDKGTFSKHNVKYRPNISDMDSKIKKKYSVHSDIDVLCVNQIKQEAYAISCKSWQSGFDCKFYLEKLSNEKEKFKKMHGRELWKNLREITDPIWSKAFRERIEDECRVKSYTYVVAVTKLKNQQFREAFEKCREFNKILSDNGKFKIKIKFLTLREIVDAIWAEEHNTAVESSEIARLIQLLKAANIKLT
ncbi:MAG: hypothetical protein IM591_15975 [Chitinophagaceae bacterium]|jgi:hypothetical protein|nr:hypothetical protein [Chitinophagaceae bacterium]MCA6496786.1 hypothetical protein [Chitinophagaceae bacterium]